MGEGAVAWERAEQTGGETGGGVAQEDSLGLAGLALREGEADSDACQQFPQQELVEALQARVADPPAVRMGLEEADSDLPRASDWHAGLCVAEHQQKKEPARAGSAAAVLCHCQLEKGLQARLPMQLPQKAPRKLRWAGLKGWTPKP